MNKKLEAALAELDVSELDELIGDIELPRDSKAGRRIAERLLRKEKITVSRSIRKKTAAVIVAAAAALGCTAVAGAYLYNSHARQRENVSKLYGDSRTAEELDSRGLLDDESREFDHFIISKDTKVLCDGYYAEFAISVIPVDADGREVTEDTEMNATIEVEAFDSEGNSVFSGGSGGFNYGEGYLGLSRECAYREYCESLPVKVKVIDMKTQEPIAELDYIFEKNVDSVDFKDESGRRIVLSEISMRCLDGVNIAANSDPKAEGPELAKAFTLVGSDGTQKDYRCSDMSATGGEEGFSYGQFPGLIDPESVSAILIDGGRFEPVG